MLVKTQSSTDNLSLELIKSHLIVEHTEDDTLIETYIKASLSAVENYLHKTIRSFEYTQTYKNIDASMSWETPSPSGEVILTYNTSELLEISEYEENYDRDNDTNYFQYANNTLTITMNDIPDDWDGEEFTMKYDIGYDEIPDEVNQARLLLIGTWYEQRASVSAKPTKVRELPHTVAFILDSFQGSPL